VAGAAGGGLGVAAHGDDAGGWEGGGAGGAGGGEGAGEHVERVAAVEVEVAGAGGVGVHKVAAEGYSEGVGAFFAGFGVGDGGMAEVGDVGGFFAAVTFYGEGEGGELEEFNAVEFEGREGEEDAAFWACI